MTTIPLPQTTGDHQTTDLETSGLLEQILADVLEKTRERVGTDACARSKFPSAAELLLRLTRGEFEEFLTTAAYSEFV
jgi:hypothetical protein